MSKRNDDLLSESWSVAGLDCSLIYMGFSKLYTGRIFAPNSAKCNGRDFPDYIVFGFESDLVMSEVKKEVSRLAEIFSKIVVKVEGV